MTLYRGSITKYLKVLDNVDILITILNVHLHKLELIIFDATLVFIVIYCV